MDFIDVRTSWDVLNYSAREVAFHSIRNTLDHYPYEFEQLTREIRDIVPSFEHEIENGIKDILYEQN